MRNKALEEQKRRYRVKSQAPFNKKVTISSFELAHTQGKAFSNVELFKEHISKSSKSSFDKLDARVRKFEERNKELYIFISLYDKILDVSTTDENANDSITSKTVNNADNRHIFMKVTNENIWAFSTISAGYLYNTLVKLLDQFLPIDYVLTQSINKDIVQIIRDEKIENLTMVTPIDPLALGFQKSSFFKTFFSKTDQTSSPYARVILDRKYNLKVIEDIEASPAQAVDCLNKDQKDLKEDIYLVTKKGRKIKGQDLKLNKICYLESFGKTKTVSWSDAVELLQNIEQELLYSEE
ncbi:TPA: hypothetical protein PXE20_002488 [Mannheimia haemolytica]|nr:hypothetical protein [Mannheimia haemolytica]HDL5625873.1 hypothetical protein [Mannheimia haemolytica]HDL5766924.1 hypothetical protein [Mannheimia haemolytica]HDL5844697.1 hypothetical protein [Mannheimia haemolytica]HDV7267868.1 hypothetical protein [Mannheimia haemolytica]